MSQSYPLIWVHLGQSKVPRYLQVSLKNFADLFPDRRLVLLVENELNLNSFGISNLEVFQTPPLNETWSLIKKTLQHDLSFRNEFWFNSIARFKAIYDYMQKHHLNRVLHVESDVTFLPSFPFDKFEALGSKLGFPLQGSGQGIASLFYVGSLQVLGEFLDYCRAEVLRNPMSTDMTILSNFAGDHKEKVVVLPTLVDANNKQGNLSNYFNGVFDAISIGQFFFGIDGRNARGLRKLFVTDLTHYVQPNEYKFEWEQSSLIATNEKSQVEVFNLHIHSKDKEALRLNSLKRKFEKRNLQSIKGERHEFALTDFMKSIFYLLKRRAKAIKVVEN